MREPLLQLGKPDAGAKWVGVKSLLLAAPTIFLLVPGIVAQEPPFDESRDVEVESDAVYGASPDSTSAQGGVAVAEAMSGPFFSKDRGYGTDAYGGPFDALLNKGYATAQYSGRDRDVLRYPYGWKSVWASLRSPFEAVERYGGWWRFIRRELIPYPGGGLKSYRWMPNYFGHTIEGGIVFRRTAEWYEARGVPMATVFAAATTYASAVVNEAYESPGESLPKGATVADLWIFDPLGILLFWNDAVARFFAQDLRAVVWPRMGSIRFGDGWVVNNGEDLVLKLPLPGIEQTRFFFKTGLGIQAGLTHSLPNGLDVSWGLGNDMRRQYVDPLTGEEDVDLELSAVLFVDRDNNLLWSVHWSETSWRILTVNVYPGVLTAGPVSFGIWSVLERDGGVNIGFTARQMQGLGVGKVF
jgi:hypothetical protein